MSRNSGGVLVKHHIRSETQTDRQRLLSHTMKGDKALSRLSASGPDQTNSGTVRYGEGTGRHGGEMKEKARDGVCNADNAMLCRYEWHVSCG